MTQTIEQPQTAITAKPDPDLDLAKMHPPRLPYHPLMQERFGIDRASWKALVEAIFPNATSTESVILALGYCRARKLDPFKRNVHIVPIWNKELGRMVDTVWPGIGELRTTAFRTGEYAGRDKAEFGQVIKKKVGTLEIEFPEWAQVTVYRVLKGQRVAFAGPQVYWLETYATVKRNDDTPNEMWATRPRGQIEKCAEAAALRAGFPEEIGSDYIPEEVEHHAKQVTSVQVDASQPRGTSALVDKLRNRQLADTQLSEEEANQLLESLAGRSVAPSSGEDSASPLVSSATASTKPSHADGMADDSNQSELTQTAPGGDGGEKKLPDTLPDHARVNQSWIDDIVLQMKPDGMAGKHARDHFHKQHAPHSWRELPHEDQDALYETLKRGEAFPKQQQQG